MTIKDAIMQIVRPLIKPQLLTVRVVSVNSNATFDAEPLNGDAKIFGVKIKPKTADLSGVYMFFKPALNSIATIGMLDGNDGAWILVKAEEYEEMQLITTGGFKCEIKANGDVIINDGNNGGIVKVQELVSKLNALEQRMLTHQHISASPASPTVVDPVTNPPLPSSTVAAMQNDKIKH